MKKIIVVNEDGSVVTTEGVLDYDFWTLSDLKSVVAGNGIEVKDFNALAEEVESRLLEEDCLLNGTDFLNLVEEVNNGIANS